MTHYIQASDTTLTMLSLGINHVKFQNTTLHTNNSIYSSIDIFSKTNMYNTAYGVGFDIVGLGTSGQSSSNYTMATQFKIGYSLYSLINYPLHIKTEVGYGITRFYDKNYWGSQYGVSLDVNIYKSIGIGIQYKFVNTGVNRSSYNTNIFFLQMSL